MKTPEEWACLALDAGYQRVVEARGHAAIGRLHDETLPYREEIARVVRLALAEYDAATPSADREQMAQVYLKATLTELRQALSAKVEYPAEANWASTRSTLLEDQEVYRQQAGAPRAAYGLIAASRNLQDRISLSLQLEQVLAYLGLHPVERAFLRRLAGDATDGDAAAIFADWLEENGRDAAGRAVRQLRPGPGTLLVFRLPRDVSLHEQDAARQNMEVVARHYGCTVLFLLEGQSLEEEHDEVMRQAGWVRATEADAARDKSHEWREGTR